MTEDINTNLAVIEQAIAWADTYKKESFPKEVFKDYRRKLRRIADALSENCSAAAYGESQVGKSYLMSSLLSTPESPFVIENNGVRYSFIDKINPSGGNNTKNESTGVITRFTIRQMNSKMYDCVRITNLSVVDIILLLADSYYNDVKINMDSVLLTSDIDNQLQQMQNLWATKTPAHHNITEDDIRDICDYLNDIIGNKAVNVYKSNFCKTIAPIIEFVPIERWVDVFGLLWNNNDKFNELFRTLINAYKKLNFLTEIYVPFEAVLREKGTLLKIDWLDSVCGIHNESNSDVLYTDVYDCNRNLIAKDYSKAMLSALIGELTFVLPEEIAKDRIFLKNIDLLDFPGARSREGIKESEIGESGNLAKILRRGKVAYLFNKYSRSLKISSVLFCHHGDQKSESTLGSSIHSWVNDNIGETKEIRTNVLSKTNGVAPLFFVCTKFNMDLSKSKQDTAETRNGLDEHWARFNKTIPELIDGSWFDEWTSLAGNSKCFQNLYLLRDFYWSSRNQVFDGYDESKELVETNVHVYEEYPEYFTDLEASFLANPFVKKHFANPQQAWNDVATINNDGSKAIIRNLDVIAGLLDEARQTRYMQQLREIRNEMNNKLSVYYESDSKEDNNIKTRQITGDIKLKTAFAFGEKPERFGRIIDTLMVPSAIIRGITFDIINRHIEVPQIVSSIKMIRVVCDIDVADDRMINIQKLCKQYCKDEQELRNFFCEQGITLEDIISDESELLATIPDIIAKHIIEFWNNHINEQVKSMSDVLPHTDAIAFTMLTLLTKLGVKKRIADKINNYFNCFDKNSLPNAIADYASLTLNNFVSTVGRDYMTDNDLEMVAQKAKSCHLEIDLSSEASTSNVKPQPLLDVLSALDQSRDVMNNSRIDLAALKKLPFWDSYQRWENCIIIGLLYVSDVSHVDPVENMAIKAIIDENKNLYN